MNFYDRKGTSCRRKRRIIPKRKTKMEDDGGKLLVKKSNLVVKIKLCWSSKTVLAILDESKSVLRRFYLSFYLNPVLGDHFKVVLED